MLSNPALAVSTGHSRVIIAADGLVRGDFHHYDSDDHFSVCDLFPDGHGVSGTLFVEEPVTDDWAIVAHESDGGDGGCDRFTYNIRVGEKYMMKVCWDTGWRGPCKDLIIIE